MDTLEDIIYKLVKAEKLARRDQLIDEYGFDWRKHEKPFTPEELQAFESKAKDLIIKEMH